MKHSLMIVIVVVFAACSWADEGKVGKPDPAELWTKGGDPAADQSVSTDHVACEAVKKADAPDLVQLKQYMDCMEAKGWKQQPEAWARYGKQPAPPAVKAPAMPAVKAPAVKAPAVPAVKAPAAPAVKAPEVPAVKAPEIPAAKIPVPPAAAQ